MKIAFTLFVLFVSLFADDNADIGFKYGFLSKSSHNSENITILSDSSIIYTGDLLKINIGYKNKTNFYIVYKDAVGSYVKLYSKEDEKTYQTIFAKINGASAAPTAGLPATRQQAAVDACQNRFADGGYNRFV